MAKITEYYALKQELENIQNQLAKMANDERFKQEIEFKEKLEKLINSYGKSNKEVIELLDPKSAAAPVTTSANSGRKKRALKVYVNPHTKETIETRGGNHKQLKEWKAEYGNDTVEGWLQSSE